MASWETFRHVSGKKQVFLTRPLSVFVENKTVILHSNDMIMIRDLNKVVSVP